MKKSLITDICLTMASVFLLTGILFPAAGLSNPNRQTFSETANITADSVEFAEAAGTGSNTIHMIMASLSSKMDARPESKKQEDSFLNDIEDPRGHKREKAQQQHQKNVESLLVDAAGSWLEDTRIGKKVKNLENTFSRYLNFEYNSNPEVKDKKAGAKAKAPENRKNFSISGKMDISNDIVFKTESSFLNNVLHTTYDIDGNNLAVEFSNLNLNKKLGLSAALKLHTRESNTRYMLQVGFNF